MKTIQFFGNGTVQTGNNTSLTPDVSSAIIPGDLVCIVAAIRTGSPRTPVGWTTLAQSGNVALMARIWQRSDVMPTVTFTGGSAGDDTLARSFALRNVPADITRVVHATAIQSNASAQDIAVPAVTTTINGCLLMNIVFKADDYTSLSRGAYFFGSSLSSTVGNDASAGVLARFQGTAGTEGAGTVAVTGGANAVSIAIALAIAPFETTYVSIPGTDRPCDFATEFTTGVDAACSALATTDSLISGLSNPVAYSVSATSGSVTSDNGLVSFSSVDIDPTGAVDLVSDPQSVRAPSLGAWFIGWYGHTALTTTFNRVQIGDGYSVDNAISVFDMDAARYSPLGGSAGSATVVRDINSLNSTSAFFNMYVSAAGTTPPTELTVYQGVMYAYRISD